VVVEAQLSINSSNRNDVWRHDVARRHGGGKRLYAERRCFERHDPLSDQFVLPGKLIEKMRRLLAVAHIRASDLGLQIVEQTARGRIEWGREEDSHRPCVVIDGRRVDWDELGRMSPVHGRVQLSPSQYSRLCRIFSRSERRLPFPLTVNVAQPVPALFMAGVVRRQAALHSHQ
jgi:hypothetical protein